MCGLLRLRGGETCLWYADPSLPILHLQLGDLLLAADTAPVVMC